MSEQHTISDEVEADTQAVFDAVSSGQSVDPDLAERVRQRAERITQEIYREHGPLDVVVDAVREARDER